MIRSIKYQTRLGRQRELKMIRSIRYHSPVQRSRKRTRRIPLKAKNAFEID
jgi:hypothetical protein